MHQSYDDIRSRIEEQPSWWDEHGVPRYGPFEPSSCGNIYANEAVLAEVKCQGCGHSFAVAFSRDFMQALCKRRVVPRPEFTTGSTLAHEVQQGSLHYGDPPNIGCCAAGPTMNSEPVRVLEFWARHDPKFVKEGVVVDINEYFEWARNPALEIGIAIVDPSGRAELPLEISSSIAEENPS